MDREKLLSTVGSAVRAIRKRRRLTIEQTAEALDVSVALISQIERGACLPSLLTFVRLMDLLEVDANTLLGRESVASAEVDAS